MAPKPCIAPSLLACDLSNLQRESEKVLASGADALHIDIMDGHFVPNLSWGPPVCQSLRKTVPNAYFDCHLMVSAPSQWIKPLTGVADRYTFHVEAFANEADTLKCIEEVKAAGMKVGLAISPPTPVEKILPFLEHIDLALVMTVNPGFGGQSFMEECLAKVSTIRAKFPELEVQVDGGVGPKNVALCAKAGANNIVAGTSVFKAEDQKAAIESMRAMVLEGQMQQA